MSDAMSPAPETPELARLDGKMPPARLRLYVARATPNSIRAEQNLLAALQELDEGKSSFALEIVDVFVHPKRAITDGVIVTPTLIGFRSKRQTTMMGDLTDSAKLKLLLKGLQDEAGQ
jgi:circadian clock protein KaiB